MDLLVPTDLSDCAADAFKTAINILSAIGPIDDHTIVLAHAIDLQEYNEHKLRAWAEAIDASQRIRLCRINKPLYEGLNELISEGSFDLLIMGSHGISGKSEWFIGSNTQRVVRRIHANVLVVKDVIDSSAITKVAYVTSALESEIESFNRFLKSIELFNVTDVHILTVNRSSFYSEPFTFIQQAQDKYKEIADSYRVRCHFYSDYSVESGARHFAEEWGIHLVGISNHNRNPVKRIIQGSNVELIINHLDVPVLSIDYR